MVDSATFGLVCKCKLEARPFKSTSGHDLQTWGNMCMLSCIHTMTLRSKHQSSLRDASLYQPSWWPGLLTTGRRENCMAETQFANQLPAANPEFQSPHPSRPTTVTTSIRTDVILLRTTCGISNTLPSWRSRINRPGNFWSRGCWP